MVTILKNPIKLFGSNGKAGDGMLKQVEADRPITVEDIKGVFAPIARGVWVVFVTVIVCAFSAGTAYTKIQYDIAEVRTYGSNNFIKHVEAQNLQMERLNKSISETASATANLAAMVQDIRNELSDLRREVRGK